MPTAALAYSLKTRGVFETCGQREQVAELRSRGTEETVEQLMDSWKKREEARCSLRETMPGVIAQAERQMELIMQLGLSRENQRESGGVTYGRP